MKIQIFQPHFIHHLGQRANQEDSLFPAENQATPESRLFLVCDGMGGHSAGEVASGIVCKAFNEYFSAKAVFTEVVDDSILTGALEFAYTKLDAADDGAYKKMGTTLTLVCFHKGGVTMAHAGDSRIYHVRPGQARPLYKSRDHSLVFDLYQAGEISYEEMKTDRRKNIITRALMPGEDNRVELSIVHTTDVMPGDYFYLCSDGMLEVMEDDELVKILSNDTSDEEKIQELLDQTQDNKDNHTAYLLKVSEVKAEEGDKSLLHDENTTRINAINIVPRVNDDISLVSGPVAASSAEDHKAVSSPVSPPAVPKGAKPGGRKREYIEALPSQTVSFQAASAPAQQPKFQSKAAPKSNITLWAVLIGMVSVLLVFGIYYINKEDKSTTETTTETQRTNTDSSTPVTQPLTTPSVSNIENEVRQHATTTTSPSSSSSGTSTSSNRQQAEPSSQQNHTSPTTGSSHSPASSITNQPSKPTQATQPSTPNKPTQSSTPTQPSKPTKPTTSSSSTQTTQSSTSTQTIPSNSHSSSTTTSTSSQSTSTTQTSSGGGSRRTTNRGGEN